jgi:hypothetical protein
MMSEEGAAPAVENGETQIIVSATSMEENQKVSEEALEFLKEIQENAGQIFEIIKEEENVVAEFFNSLLKILRKFAKVLQIPVSSLSESYGKQVSKAYLYPNGQLVLVYEDAEAELINLKEQDNHEILVAIAGGIMMELRSIINSYKARAEKRVKFLLSITKELQKVAKVFMEE